MSDVCKGFRSVLNTYIGRSLVIITLWIDHNGLDTNVHCITILHCQISYTDQHMDQVWHNVEVHFMNPIWALSDEGTRAARTGFR